MTSLDLRSPYQGCIDDSRAFAIRIILEHLIGCDGFEHHIVGDDCFAYLGKYQVFNVIRNHRM